MNVPQKPAPIDAKELRISYAQSWNLAATMVAPVYSALSQKETDIGAKEKFEITKRGLEEWQEYFYGKLVNEPLEEQEKKE